MHVSFIAYGERDCVERLFRDMEAQQHLMPMTNGKQKRGAYIPGQIRTLPFGITEYVFAKDSLDMVLRTMKAATSGVYGINFKRLVYPFLRKVMKLKKIPKYEEAGKVFMWRKQFVSIMVLGIREDGDIVGTYVDDKGWTHEGL